jgi:hypothetical protein
MFFSFLVQRRGKVIEAHHDKHMAVGRRRRRRPFSLCEMAAKEEQ